MEPKLPRTVYAILLSWGIAVLMLAGLFAWWISSNEQEARERAAAIQLEQDRAMCGILGIIVAGPPPVAGPAGDRGREAMRAFTAYRAALRCNQILPAAPS